MSGPQRGYIRDPEHVRAQYASETNLAARSSLYSRTTGPFAGDVALAAVAELRPRAVLEVGAGTGWFAERVEREVGADVVALDQSERMVELERERGLDARVGDVRELPFADGSFDCVVANWMLYHLDDLDRGLREIVRVLRQPGRLVATTNGHDHLIELWELVGAREAREQRDLQFARENGEDVLRRHFAQVGVRDASGTVAIDDRAAVVRYVSSISEWQHLADRVPDPMEPFVAGRDNVVFVADR